uniref:Uncharacterized protein n=1 Tax=Arundo donax TaxID=35708 RepID=A0A0A9APX2_ARUDO
MEINTTRISMAICVAPVKERKKYSLQYLCAYNIQDN